MSNRERWTVYPLLFLTLGIALKDKVTKEITADKVRCNAVWVTDRAGKPELVLGHVDRLTGLMFVDPKGAIVPPSIVVKSAQPVAQPRGQAPTRQGDQPPPAGTPQAQSPGERPSSG